MTGLVRSNAREAVLYRLGAIIPLLLGLGGLLYSYARLSLGALSAPEPGLWPFILSAALVVTAAALLLAERDDEQYEPITRRARRIGYGIASLVLFILIFKQIGFIVPGLLAFAFWIRVLGGESWRTTIAVSMTCTVGFYLLFDVLLGVPLPDDLVGSLIAR